MLKNIAALTLLTLFAGLAQAKNYGEAIPAGKAIDIAVAAQSVETYAGKPTKFKGRITRVCQMKGCWLMIESNGLAARITMKDDALVIPKDSTGEVVVFGEISRVKVESDAKIKEASKSSLASPGQLQITATSITIEPEENQLVP